VSPDLFAGRISPGNFPHGLLLSSFLVNIPFLVPNIPEAQNFWEARQRSCYESGIRRKLRRTKLKFPDHLRWFSERFRLSGSD
jgi:hypothetical protein